MGSVTNCLPIISVDVRRGSTGGERTVIQSTKEALEFPETVPTLRFIPQYLVDKNHSVKAHI